MTDDPLKELAAAATRRGTPPLSYQAPAASPAPSPVPAKGLFRMGFFFGLGFFSAGVVFWITIVTGSIVLGGLLATSCAVVNRAAPAPQAPTWNLPR